MRHIVTTKETHYAIPNADGTLIYGTCPAGCNISTGQPVCETSEDGATYYDLIMAEAVPWAAGLAISTVPVTYEGEIYQPLQKHTAQSDWTPDVVPALFREIGKPTPSGYPAWEQRYAAPYYRKGDRVAHNGQNWQCTAADANGNNVWEPGVYGWTVI
jgi:hypothetical protein